MSITKNIFYRMLSILFIGLMLTSFLDAAPTLTTLRITQGVEKPIPIRIQKTGVLNSVIIKDLQNTGRFILFDINHSATDYGIKITKNCASTCQVSAYLRVRLQHDAVMKNLWAKSYSNIPKSELPRLGHIIANAVYQKLTGNPGFFTTKLVYINKTLRSNTILYQLVVADYDGSHAQVLLAQKGIPIATPAWSPNGKKIAYMTFDGYRSSIYLLDVFTGKRIKLTSFPGINSSPAFSPDGKSLLLALANQKNGVQTQIYKMDIESRKIKQLTNLGLNTSASFSPDGKEIVFTSNRGGSPQIYRMDRNGRHQRRLTYQAGVSNYEPVFADHGNAIVCMSQSSSSGLILLSKLVKNKGVWANTLIPLTEGPYDKSPTVAPDGQMIMYSKIDERGNVGLALVSLNGKVQAEMTHIDVDNMSEPNWSIHSF